MAHIFLLNRIKAWVGSRGGNVGMIFAAAAAPLLAATGVGVDMARYYAAKIQLSAALDAAALAVGSSDPNQLSLAQLQQRMQGFFAANYPKVLGTPPTPTMTYAVGNNNVINFTATATIPTTFLRVAKVTSLPVSVATQVTRGASASLEVALVLDNTGSMQCGDDPNNCATGTPPSHIDSLKSDATNIVNTLFSNSLDTSKLKIAIVPYVTAVNVGPALSQSNSLNTYVPSVSGVYKDLSGKALVDASGHNIVYDPTQSPTSQGWKGCVIEPIVGGYDVSEPTGGWTAQKWNAFYWESGTSTSFNGNVDNTWFIQAHSPSTSIQYVIAEGNTSGPDQNSHGPNLACPTPLVRLTNNQTTLTNATKNMTAWPRSGTAIHVGMIWGWRALSPNPPFSDGQAYATPHLIKAVVLETDGVNNIDAPLSSSLTGLGKPSDGRAGPTPATVSSMLSTLDSRLTTVCNNMGAAGIVIYTIGLGQGATNQALSDCATKNGGQFFPAPTAAALQQAFQQVAASLNNLRLSK
jgi:Flp pilus assembly protein TadG